MIIKREFNFEVEDNVFEFIYDTIDKSIVELYTGREGMDEDGTFYKKMLNEDTESWELFSYLD